MKDESHEETVARAKEVLDRHGIEIKPIKRQEPVTWCTCGHPGMGCMCPGLSWYQ